MGLCRTADEFASVRLHWFVLLAEERYFEAQDERAAIEQSTPKQAANTSQPGKRVTDTRKMSAKQLIQALQAADLAPAIEMNDEKRKRLGL